MQEDNLKILFGFELTKFLPTKKHYCGKSALTAILNVYNVGVKSNIELKV
jgi:hypothetical protein